MSFYDVSATSWISYDQSDIGFAGAFLSKIDAENAVLVQKRVTELAQTDVFFDDGTDTYSNAATGVTVAGIIGKQKSLYGAQTDGFARDAEQKLAKIVADAYSVRQSTDAGATVPSALDANSIDDVIAVARAGIGINDTSFDVETVRSIDETNEGDIDYNDYSPPT